MDDKTPSMKLSARLKDAGEHSFAGNMNKLGVQFCQWSVDAERLEEALQRLVAAMHPHYREHPTMYPAWVHARQVLGEEVPAHEQELAAMAEKERTR